MTPLQKAIAEARAAYYGAGTNPDLVERRGGSGANYTEDPANVPPLVAIKVAAAMAAKERADGLDKQLRAKAGSFGRDLTASEHAEIDALTAQFVEASQEASDEITRQERFDIANRAAVLNRDSSLGREMRVGGARVTREERTYTPQKSERGEASFMCDAFAVTASGDFGARQRLERHLNEVQVEGEVSKRATTTSSFAGLIVPQYLVEQAALVSRAGRPFANSVAKLQLPDQGTTFEIPRGTTGASTAIQASENANVSNTDEAWSNLALNVATIAGQQDVSRQSLERGTPGLDALIYTDLAGAYASSLDAQTLSGSGSSGQVTGVLNQSGIAAAVAYGAAITAAKFTSKVAGAVNSITTSRFLPPDSIAMSPRRWAWLLSQSDSQGRPLVVPTMNGPMNAVSTGDLAHAYGDTGTQFLGLQVYVDANIPTTVGTNSEDVCCVYRSRDILLWEDGDGMPRQLRFEQTLGNQLTVKLVAYGYLAFTAGRYPTAVALTGGADSTAGNGQIAPTF
jgi:HK97 family phage major capsid protein